MGHGLVAVDGRVVGARGRGVVGVLLVRSRPFFFFGFFFAVPVFGGLFRTVPLCSRRLVIRGRCPMM